ncbi:conserved Plasmodium protein, unknown function [Plasmodium ovale curtisi]|uniref:Uncharacterized protein n=1 Tax=Plasmodium ovale curtisi TaxID=864141 RepID=A0A1A8VXB1_PLAOA|nr:conserved Plasmodium protein, unknown function [Plasmodium ovale curtisi]
MSQYILHAGDGERRERKQYDNVVAEALKFYRREGVTRRMGYQLTDNTEYKMEKKFITKEISEERVESFRNDRMHFGAYSDVNTRKNKGHGAENDQNNFLWMAAFSVSNEQLKDVITAKLRGCLDEYLHDVREEKCREISNCTDKKKLLKKYIYEVKRNNFSFLENVYFFLSMYSDYDDYALGKLFHSLLLPFEKDEEKNLLLIIYIFLTILKNHNIEKYFIHIIDALIHVLHADEWDLPINKRDENIRPFDHKPMGLKNQTFSETVRYFLFLYFYFLTRSVSSYQLSNHAEKIVRVCVTGLFDNCSSINCLMMNLVEERISQIENNYVNYCYIISVCLLKCLCNRYSKIKIKCMNTLIEIIMHSNNKNYRIIEMLIGYKDPNIIPIKSFYDSSYVNVNYLCLLYNDKSVKVKYHFYTFLFILLYEFIESGDFLSFILPYLFSACFDYYKICRCISFLYIQLIAKKKKSSSFHANINEDITYELYPEWSYKTAFTLPLPLTDFYFPTYYRSSFLIKENMYKLNLSFPLGGEKDPSGDTRTKGEEKQGDIHTIGETWKSSNLREEERTCEYYEELLFHLISSNKRVLTILRENKVKSIDITCNEMRKECKQLSYTLLNVYFKYLYKKKEDSWNKRELLESSKIILTVFYFIEDNITEHIPSFISYMFNAFEMKIDDEQWCIYMNCLYLIGAYVKPSNYFFFFEKFLKFNGGQKEKHITLTSLYMINAICSGTIQTHRCMRESGLTQGDINDDLVVAIKKMIPIFFRILNRGNYMENHVLVLQIMHTIIGSESLYRHLEEKQVTQLIVLLHIIFNKIRYIRESLSGKKDKICIHKNLYIPVEVFNVHFYITRVRGTTTLEDKHLMEELPKVKISPEILYEVFELSGENTYQQKIIFGLLSDEMLYKTNYVYFLIQYAVKRQTFFYNKSFSLFLCNVIIKLFNLPNNKKNILKVLLYGEVLQLNDIYDENKGKNKNKVRHTFIEYSCTLFLLFIFLNLNIYEQFSSVVEACKMVLHVLTEIKDPFSFLFFAQRTSLADRLCDILECREIKSIYFCKYVLSDLHLNCEKYVNNDGDYRYLDNINIKRRINIREKVNREVSVLHYFITSCLYLLYYKSLCCIYIVSQQENGDNEKEAMNQLFHITFGNTHKRLLNIIKINEKRDYTFLNTYTSTVKDLLQNKDISELYLLRRKILSASDYNTLILNIHIYFRHSFTLLQNVNTFLLNPVILNYFYEVNKEPCLQSPNSRHTQNGNHLSENGQVDGVADEGKEYFMEIMETFFNANNVDDIINVKYDHTELLSYLRNHDLAFIILKNHIYNIPFRVIENNSIIILLYSSLLFFADSFFIFDVPQVCSPSALSNSNVGLCATFFQSAKALPSDLLTALLNFSIMLYLENEDILRGALKKRKEYKKLEGRTSLDTDIFSNILNNIITSYDNQNANKESLCECVNFFLNVLSSNYPDVFTSLKDIYTRTNRVKRLETHVSDTDDRQSTNNGMSKRAYTKKRYSILRKPIPLN